MTEKMTAIAAAKLIRPGTVKVVHFQFAAIGGSIGWLRVPKVEARRMLRALMPGSLVRVDLQAPIAWIMGAINEETFALSNPGPGRGASVAIPSGRGQETLLSSGQGASVVAGGGVR